MLLFVKTMEAKIPFKGEQNSNFYKLYTFWWNNNFLKDKCVKEINIIMISKSHELFNVVKGFDVCMVCLCSKSYKKNTQYIKY